MSAFILSDRYFAPESGHISSYFSQLYMLIGHSSVRYTILDTEKNTFVGLASYTFSPAPKSSAELRAGLERLFSEDDYLARKYPSVTIGIDSERFTMVPFPLFDDIRAREILSFNFRLQENSYVLTDKIAEISAYLVYEMDNEILSFFRERFKDSLIMNRMSGLLRTGSALQRQSGEPGRFMVNIRENFIDLVFFRDNQPVLCNAYPYSGKEDILYFILNACEQLKLRPGDLDIIVSGQFQPDSETARLLNRYVGKLKVADPIQLFEYNGILKQMAPHRYTDLFSLAL
ncbi:MAG TPA: DUF3822 family protein [Bacteroidales bacterium]|nr:DUF3822 family protein [Bacteroidales bacterium]